MSNIYFDHASTTYVYPEIAEIISDTIRIYWGNPMNLYSFGQKSAKLVEEARKRFAKCIGADPEEIIFTSCASESNALAINQFESCYCSPYEHHDIKENKKVKIMDSSTLKLTSIIPDCYDSYLGSLYAHMLVNNETGEIFDIDEIIKSAHIVGMKVLIDATQALGNININVHKIDADYMSFSLHKVHAPKGIGVLYVKKSLQNEFKPLIYGTQEHNMRGGTSNVPYIVGGSYAAEQACEEMEHKQIISLLIRQRIIETLKQNNVDFIVNEGHNNIPSILNISFKGITGEALMLFLDQKGFCVSTGSACNSGDQKPSEVLSYMKVPEEYINGAIRISCSIRNTTEEAEKLANAISEVILNV